MNSFKLENVNRENIYSDNFGDKWKYVYDDNSGGKLRLEMLRLSDFHIMSFELDGTSQIGSNTLVLDLISDKSLMTMRKEISDDRL